MKDYAMLGVLVALIGMVLVLVAAGAPRDRRVMRPRKGLELKARKGRLVHVRETESEHEV